MIRQLLIGVLLVYSSLSHAGNIADAVHATCTARVDGMAYTAYYYTSEKFEIRDAKGALVLLLKASNTQLNYAGFSGFKFVDFDGDNYKDLLIEYMSNVPAIYDLVIYNKKLKSFIKVNGFEQYPAPLKLPGTNVYYSYHRSGCADMNWDSDLFVIKDFKPVKLGNINGAECGDSGIKDGIYINKFVNGKKTLYKQLPVGTIKQYKNYKWGFIKSYWEKHYKAFLNSSPRGRI